MAKTTVQASYRAELFGAPRAGQSLEGKPPDRSAIRRLLGFCVVSLLDQSRVSRSDWAGRLRISQSHLSRMASDPTSSFIARLDLALANASLSSGAATLPAQRNGQRLKPKLMEFYVDVRPDERMPERSVLQWLARDARPRLSGELAYESLLRSEVAMTRAQMLTDSGRSDLLDKDNFIKQSLQELLCVSSSPYGGVTIAMQRAVELGLEAPVAFFGVMQKHAENSPVAFRLLRLLDRYIQRFHSAPINDELPPLVATYMSTQITTLLQQFLGRAASGETDPYPGAEWSTTLAFDRLGYHGDGHVIQWLRGRISDEDASDRERLYAAWAYLAFPRAARTKVIEQLQNSGSPWLSKWGGVFASSYLRKTGNPWSTLSECAENTFATERRHIREVVTPYLGESTQLSGVRESLTSILSSAVYTPDGQLRRNLIEAVIAAGLSRTVLPILENIYTSADANTNGPREAILFFISRLREPSALPLFLDIIGEPNSSDREGDPHIIHTALWGIGDVYDVNVTPQDELKIALNRLLLYITDPPDVSPKQRDRHRIAAAHALLVIAIQSSMEDSTMDGVTLKTCALGIRDVALQASGHQGKTRIQKIIGELMSWGIQVIDQRFDDTKRTRRRMLVDPSQLRI